MNLFHPDDHDRLVADPDLFDADRLQDTYGAWGGQFLRNALALEVLAQLTPRVPGLVVKGGTLLQSRLQWPPRRASVDLDLETRDPAALQAALTDVVRGFDATAPRLTFEQSIVPGFLAHISFGDEPPTVLRVDALAFSDPPAGSKPWPLPEPWKRATPPLAAPLETQAAQKLLLAAPLPYGRDTGQHLGRQNLVKDLYDLRCLADEDLDGARIVVGAAEDVERKSNYLDRDFELDGIAAGAQQTLRVLADAPVNDRSTRGSLWRARTRVQGGIRDAFPADGFRIATGCAHHSLHCILEGELDWQDAWLPATKRVPRRAWSDAKAIETVVEADDDFGAGRGVREAWAKPRP